MSNSEARLVVVTGGTKGIGAAVADQFRAAGDRVEAVGRERCDVTDEASVKKFFAEVGPVDVLVNNAGVSASAPIGKTGLDAWEGQFAVNATGAFLATREVVDSMRSRGSGRIIFVSSIAGLAGGKYISAYAASKHAMVGLMRSVAVEVAGSGVTANAVCPGYVRTPMTERNLDRITEVTGRDRGEAEAAVEQATLLGRLLEPEEVAAAVYFLASPDAISINGQAIAMDGGGMRT